MVGQLFMLAKNLIIDRQLAIVGELVQKHILNICWHNVVII